MVRRNITIDYILLIWIVFSPFFLFSQEPSSVNYIVEDGLLSNETYDLFEDRDGFVWIATNKGAVRFNSNEMQAFTVAEGLADSDVLSIHQDSKGNIWFLPYNGELSYWREGKVYNAKNDQRLKEISSGNYFTSFYEDKGGTIWFGTYGNGAFSIDSSNRVCNYAKTIPQTTSRGAFERSKYLIVSAVYSHNDKIHFSNNVGNYYLEENDFRLLNEHENRHQLGRFVYTKDRLFSSTSNHISRLDLNNGRTKWTSTLSTVKQINGLEYLSDGQLYACTNKGVYILDEEGNKVDSLLLGKQASDAIIDREGNLWISTLQNGVFLIKNRGVLNYNTKAKYSILKTENSLLLGGQDLEIHSVSKAGIVELPIKHVEYSIALEQDKILTFFEDSNKQIWFGSYNGLFYLDNGKSNWTRIVGVKELLYFNQSLFVSITHFGLLQFDGKTIQSIYQSHKLHDGKAAENPSEQSSFTRELLSTRMVYPEEFHCLSKKNEGYFLGGTNKGVVRYNDSGFDLLDYLPKGKILAIEEEDLGNIWLLEKDKGLYYYQVEQDKLDTIQLFEQEKAVSYITLRLEKDKNIWVGTDRGLINVKAIEDDYKVNYIDKKNGLGSEEINDLMIVNDTIWLATSKGISFLPKKSLKDTIPPLLFIDSVIVNEGVVNDSHLVNLTSNENTLFVHFTGISFKDEGDLQYKYELRGASSRSGSITDQELLLNDLLPSQYVLSITAVDLSGNRSELKELHFNIKLLWWKNWRYWLVIFLGALLLVALCIRIFFKKKFKEIYALLSGKGRLMEKEKFIIVKSVINGATVKISLNELFYIKVSGDYTEFFKKDKMILVRSSMKSIEEQLQEEQAFVRVHKSYIVNLSKAETFKSDGLEMLGQEIPISRRKREEVRKVISSLL